MATEVEIFQTLNIVQRVRGEGNMSSRIGLDSLFAEEAVLNRTTCSSFSNEVRKDANPFMGDEQ